MALTNQKTEEAAKEAAGKAAAYLIENGMVVGLGTGTTAKHFITHLAKRCREGLQIRGVCSSKQSEQLAREANIPLLSPEEIDQIDLTVDGADEIDPQKQMIKGGGGALLREKIVASTSSEMIVIVDESKIVPQLGKMPLPVEVIPFGYRWTIQKINRLGLQGTLRQRGNAPFITDNGNYIYDIHFEKSIDDVKELDETLLSISGVVETGIFLQLAGRVLIGKPDGSVEHWE